MCQPNLPMKYLPTTLTAAALAAAPALGQGVVGDDGALTTYAIGNSLTRGLSVGNGTTGNRLQQLFADGGIDYTYGTQLGAGFRLYQHLDQQAGGGSGSASFNNENSVGAPAFGDYDNALRNFDFDALILQPFMHPIDAEPGPSAAPDRRFVIGARQATNAFIDYARGLPPQIQNSGRYVPPGGTGRYDLDNPNSNFSTGNFYIYETWPGVGDIYDDSQSDTYADYWDQPYTSGTDALPSRDSFDDLIGFVNADNPDLDTPVRVIPVGEVLYELDLAIRDGALPGIEDFYDRSQDYFVTARRNGGNPPPFDPDDFDPQAGVLNFYADGIHLNDQPHNGPDSGTIGAYVAALTHYAVLTGESPVGLGVGPYEQLDSQADAALIEALQQTVWDVVTSDPNTGVVPEPSAAVGVGAAGTLLTLRRRR